MTRILAAALIAVALPAGAQTASPPGLSPGTAQLAASVQYGLDALGYRGVDARTLSTAQLVELKFLLSGAPPIVGPRSIRLRQRVETALRRQPINANTNVNQ